jgi:hypothetical protein
VVLTKGQANCDWNWIGWFRTKANDYEIDYIRGEQCNSEMLCAPVDGWFRTKANDYEIEQRNSEKLCAPIDRNHWPDALHTRIRSGYFKVKHPSPLLLFLLRTSLKIHCEEQKGGVKPRGYCSLPSVVHSILRGANLVTHEKPQTPKGERKNIFNSKLEQFMALKLLLTNWTYTPGFGLLLTFLNTCSKQV